MGAGWNVVAVDGTVLAVHAADAIVEVTVVLVLVVLLSVRLLVGGVVRHDEGKVVWLTMGEKWSYTKEELLFNRNPAKYESS